MVLKSIKKNCQATGGCYTLFQPIVLEWGQPMEWWGKDIVPVIFCFLLLSFTKRMGRMHTIALCWRKFFCLHFLELLQLPPGLRLLLFSFLLPLLLFKSFCLHCSGCLDDATLAALGAA